MADTVEYTFEEENKRDTAARVIQRKVRVRIARKNLVNLFKESYVKVYDEVSDQYVYKNKFTLEISYDKPRLLGNDDLPSPRKLEAPTDYNPGEENKEIIGYALIVTVNEFNSDKLQTVPHSALSDHILIEDLLTHDFICKIPPENATFIKNPTTGDFKQAVDRFRRVCTKKSFFVLYMATNVVTVLKGEKKNKKETCYFAMKNTDWTNPTTAASTSISLTNFCTWINSIPSKKKTMFMNITHGERQKDTFFARPRLVYPPPDFYNRLVNECNCALIAACTIGTLMDDLVKSTPFIDSIKYVEIKEEEKDELKNLLPQNLKKIDDDDESTISKKSRRIQAFEVASAEEKQSKEEASNYENTTNRYMGEWKLQYPPEVTTSAPPAFPQPAWKKDVDTGWKYEVKLPADDEFKVYDRQLKWWKLKTRFAPAVNYFKERRRKQQIKEFKGPYQYGLSDEYGTFFGKAFIDGINGGACVPENKVLDVETLFTFMHAHLKKSLAALPDPETDSNNQKPNQSFVLLTPKGDPKFLKYPVCFKVGPPCAPEKPFIVRIDATAVLLEWYLPPFSGIAPLKYQIKMRNVSRRFKEWTTIYTPGDIKKTKFLVRDLPTGIPCQFQIQSFNNGGWGLKSRETNLVTPGEDLMPIDDKTRWARLGMGGALAIMDRLNEFPFHRHEYVTGLKKLNSYGSKSLGFKKGVQLNMCKLALHAIKTFIDDREIFCSALLLIGWSLRGNAQRKVIAFCTQNNVFEIMVEMMSKYRNDPRIIGAISWVRSTAQLTRLPIPPPIVIEEEKESSSEDSQDEEVIERKQKEKEEKDARDQWFADKEKEQLGVIDLKKVAAKDASAKLDSSIKVADAKAASKLDPNKGGGSAKSDNTSKAADSKISVKVVKFSDDKK